MRSEEEEEEKKEEETSKEESLGEDEGFEPVYLLTVILPHDHVKIDVIRVSEVSEDELKALKNLNSAHYDTIKPLIGSTDIVKQWSTVTNFICIRFGLSNKDGTFNFSHLWCDGPDYKRAIIDVENEFDPATQVAKGHFIFAFTACHHCKLKASEKPVVVVD